DANRLIGVAPSLRHLQHRVACLPRNLATDPIGYGDERLPAVLLATADALGHRGYGQRRMVICGPTCTTRRKRLARYSEGALASLRETLQLRGLGALQRNRDASALHGLHAPERSDACDRNWDKDVDICWLPVVALHGESDGGEIRIRGS